MNFQNRIDDTDRLLKNLTLMRPGHPVTIIPPVVRGACLDALKASNQGDNQPFINLLSSMVWEGHLRDYLRLLESNGIQSHSHSALGD